MPQMKSEMRMDQDERDLYFELVVRRGNGLAAGDLIVDENCDQPSVIERGFGQHQPFVIKSVKPLVDLWKFLVKLKELLTYL
jgi:hypothetical protein